MNTTQQTFFRDPENSFVFHMRNKNIKAVGIFEISSPIFLISLMIAIIFSYLTVNERNYVNNSIAPETKIEKKIFTDSKISYKQYKKITITSATISFSVLGLVIPLRIALSMAVEPCCKGISK